jgi:hypothetical protein
LRKIHDEIEIGGNDVTVAHNPAKRAHRAISGDPALSHSIEGIHRRCAAIEFQLVDNRPDGMCRAISTGCRGQGAATLFHSTPDPLHYD